MTESRTIYISNDDKDIGESESNSNFVCYLKERVSVQQSNYSILKTITLCNCFYNVRGSASYGEAANNTFIFQEQSPLATFGISVPEGQYLIQDYITALEAAMNLVLVSGTVAITQDPVNGKLIFTCTGTQINVFSGNNGNLSYELTGFDQINNSGFGAVVNAPYLPDLSGIQNAFIESRELASGQGNDPTFGIVNLLGQINLSSTAFGAYAHFQANDDELATINYKNEKNIERIQIRVVDNQGNTLPVGNSRVSLSLKYFFE